jgi:hypothetical protein
MNVFSGPEIANDGLLFYYDMENLFKSFKGKPVTNLVNPSWSSWSVDGSGQGSIGTRTILSSYHCRIYDVNQNTRQNIFISGVSANTEYTFSVKFKKISGQPTLRFQIQAYNGETSLSTMAFATTAELGITDIEGWQIATITLTTPSNTTRVLWFIQDGDDYVTYTHSFELKEPQMEQSSFASAFVDGTRTSAQSVMDVTNRSQITVNNLNYSSNESFSFLWSNPSYITIPLATAFNKTEGTMNFWLYPTRYNGGNGYFVNREDANANATDWFWIGPYSDTFYFRLGNGSDCCSNDLAFGSVSTVIPLNTWVNMCFTWKANGTSVIYKNGVLLTSRSIGNVPSTNPASNGRIGLGHANADNYFNGIMPSVSIYSRQLTANEVFQNFIARKDRYGI